ncbi:glycosyltransferase [Halobacillus shinanisalinarum]|uniref:Glycosyltransferase n=1 Tax=Halobacillus shinanisalinarum TaxID=2932258 RepID=A0ABY4H1V6_9BACI|nr:glycosyltransferase [Halobacillus shinanisalinarum]UOQ94423.1 glycosyltransferase [Halobacillus shinanisalinarum]
MKKKQPIFFLMNSIDLVRGGLTRASLNQASTFAEMGYEVQMITFNYNLNYPKIREKLIKMGKVNPNVVIRNLYEELEGDNDTLSTSSSILKKTILSELTNEETADKREGHNAYRVYENGLYTRYISFDGKDRLQLIDYFNENRYRTKRVEYDTTGEIRKISYMDFLENKARQIILYNQDGKAYLSQWNNPKNAKIQRINLFNTSTGEIERVYTSGSTIFKKDWLEDILVNMDEPIVISDTRSTDDVLAKLNPELATKIWRLHSSHVNYPFDVNGEITSKVKTGIANLNNYDGAFVLTNEQKEDLVNRYGKDQFFHVVPHYHEDNNKKGIKGLFTNTSTNPKLAVIVSRLSTLKRVDHSIKAFKTVVEHVPDAKLEIWGTGTEDEKLASLINELNLSNNVELKGYTHKPDEIYQKALFSILTSKSEGFALSVLESMVNKTPVVSYNIKYGPSDLIQDNVTGKLVEDKDIDSLAQEMIYLFENPEEAKELGVKGSDYINRNFNKELYKEKFISSIEKAEQYKKSEK